MALTPEQQEALAKFKENLPKAEDEDPKQADMTDGKNVDWSQYILDNHYKHFYPRARLMDTEQGPKWIAPFIEYFGENVPYNKGKVEQWLEAYVNGPDAWSLVAVVPNGSGLAHPILRRNNIVRLPDPEPIEVSSELATPAPETLEQLDAASKAWAAENGPAAA